MKLYFDPKRHAVVTDTGELVEGVTNLSISYSATDRYGSGGLPRCDMTLYMDVAECPEVSMERIDSTVKGLLAILDGR